MEIRRATEDDVPLILEFICELAKFERLRGNVSATEEVLRTSLFGPQHHVEALLGYVDGKPVAFAIYFFSFSSFLGTPNLYLEDIFVKSEFRGAGLGRQMMAAVAQHAIERGCSRMEWAVLNWNREAFGFYEKLGAKPVTDWTGFHLPNSSLKELAKLK
jgi:GNAT superfamily N-acetyltransferase